MSAVTNAVTTGPELLRFKSFEDWVNHAQTRFAIARERYRVSNTQYICIDATGRICAMGRQFMSARDRDAFPVVVYHVDPDFDTETSRPKAVSA